MDGSLCLILWRTLEGKLHLRVLSTQGKGTELSYFRGMGFHIPYLSVIG